MDKQALRDRVWTMVEQTGVARFPGARGRIPNFPGAEAAARLLATTHEWHRARTLKCNPDAPQLPVRALALAKGKTVVMAVPRLRTDPAFLALEPQRLSDRVGAGGGSAKDWRAIASIRGAARYGRPVALPEIPPIDLVVCGSVAVNRQGDRLGKGGGYSDIEFGLLAARGAIGRDTAIVTTVHPVQVVADAIPMLVHDIPVDLIVTPDEILRCPRVAARPEGIYEHLLPEEKRRAIPVLAVAPRRTRRSRG